MRVARVDIWDQATVAYHGQDGTAELTIHVASQEYRWKLGSDNDVQLNGEPFLDIIDVLNSDGIRSALESAKAIVAIGVASEELTAEGETAETRRADARATTMVSWLRRFARPGQPLYRLTLGRHVSTLRTPDPEGAGTARQRAIVLVTVTSMDDGVELGDALRVALKEKSLPFALDNYPHFMLTRSD